jgi:hypothetical protein
MSVAATHRADPALNRAMSPLPRLCCRGSVPLERSLGGVRLGIGRLEDPVFRSSATSNPASP